MSNICDKCGKKFFISSHDMMPEFMLLKVALKDLRHDLDHPVIRKNAAQNIDSIISWLDFKIVAGNRMEENHGNDHRNSEVDNG